MRPTDLTPGQLGRWREIQGVSGVLDSPFLSPHFAIAVAEQRPTARLAVIEEDGSALAFLAYEHHRGGIAKPIGSLLSDYQAIVVAPDLDLDLRELLVRLGLRAWDFDHLAASQASRLEALPRRISATEAPMMDLRGGFDHYREECGSKSLFSDTAYQRRRLERKVGEVEFILHSPDRGRLDLLLGWKSEQYRRTGRRDRFADEGNRRLLHRLLDMSFPDFAGGLALLTAGGTPVAGAFYLRSPTVLSYWFPAYDPAYRAYSPGIVLLTDLARAVAASGPRLLDLGKGHEPYKDRFASWTYPLLEGQLARDRSILGLRRTYQLPRDLTMSLVLSSDRLRRYARAGLRWVGSVRRFAHDSVRERNFRNG